MKKVDPNNENTYHRVEVSSTLREARKPADTILGQAEACGYDQESRFAIKLALEEAITNAVRHGNRNDASKRVIIRFAVTPEQIVICIKDEGAGFAPECIPDPTLPDRISLPCGRGIMLIKAYMNDVAYRCNGREIRMVKKNPGAAGGTGRSKR